MTGEGERRGSRWEPVADPFRRGGLGHLHCTRGAGVRQRCVGTLDLDRKGRQA